MSGRSQIWGLAIRCLIFIFAFSFQCLSGVAGDPSSPKDELKDGSSGSSSAGGGEKVLFVFLGMVALVGFSIFLFKLYQKKKREEQHARLLRLFEEDDELELELGLRE